jgi:cysteine desulfurase
MTMHPIYLDHNATTPLRPEAAEAMARLAAEPLGNPASGHAAGRRARRILEDAREQVAGMLGATPAEVVFTSGATEANNLAIFGLVPRGTPARILAAKFEHPCVMEPLRVLAEAGAVIEWMDVNERGVMESPKRGDSVPLSRDGRGTLSPRFGCLMLANHETGAIQPVREFARQLPGVPLHTDAAQAVGKIPVNFRDLGCTTLTASAHKFGGPVGIGLLIVKEGTKLKPLTFGGHQQRGQRPGTESVVLAAGLAAALDHAGRNMDRNLRHGHTLRARFLAELRKHGCTYVVNGPAPGEPDGLPTTLNLSFPGCRAELLLMALDLAGIACSTGSACSSGSLLPSPVLQAMGVPEEVLQSAMRFSFGPDQSEAEAAEAAARVATVVQAMG